MNISFEKPEAFLLLFLLIPALFFDLFYLKKIRKTLKSIYSNANDIRKLKKIIRSTYTRITFWTIAFASLVTAFSCPYFGQKEIAVQKNPSSSIMFVFDISYSMTAEDVDFPLGFIKNGEYQQKQLSRLEASKQYAFLLMEYLENSSVGVVLAKGDGVLTIPLTQDFTIIETFITSLNPKLSTSTGSNIGLGVKKAADSFPYQSSDVKSIVLFTDGDETSKTLEDNVKYAVEQGCSVIIVGCGNVNSTEIISGDGETPVETSLQEDFLKGIASGIKASPRYRKLYDLSSRKPVLYTNILEKGSAIEVLSTVIVSKFSNTNGNITEYELQNIPQHSLFIFIAIVLFVLGYVISKFSLPFSIARKTASLIVGLTMFSSCSINLKATKDILEGSVYYHQKNYDKAATSFLKMMEYSKENCEELLPYGTFALGSTYLMQNEVEASKKRFEEIPSDASDKVKFAMNYNIGIIAYHQGDFALATESFRKALEIDNTDLNAKINFELSLAKNSIKKEELSKAKISSSKNNEEESLEDGIFNFIKENESVKWKDNQEESQNQTDKNTIDY